MRYVTVDMSRIVSSECQFADVQDVCDALDVARAVRPTFLSGSMHVVKSQQCGDPNRVLSVFAYMVSMSMYTITTHRQAHGIVRS